MRFIDDFFSLVWDISDWLYEAYLTVHGWVWPFWHLETPLYYLHVVFWKLLTPISRFGDFVDYVADKIAQIFTREEGLELTDYAKNILRTRIDDVDKLVSQLSDDAKDIIKPALDKLRKDADFLTDYAKNILAMDIADLAKRMGLTEEEFRDWLRPKINNLEGDIGSLSSSLQAEIETIDRLDKEAKENTKAIGENTTWITSVKRFTDSIKLFFTNPLDWLLDNFTDWFLGKE